MLAFLDGRWADKIAESKYAYNNTCSQDARY